MDLKDIIERLRQTVPRYSVEYAVARERQPALAPYPTGLAALEALRDVSALGFEERGQLVLAIVHEQQIKAHPLWQAMLVCAFAPMLRRLRGHLRHMAHEDRDQEVLVCFLEAVHALPPVDKPGHTEVALRRATARAAFRAAIAEKKEATNAPFDEETHPADPFSDVVQRALVEASAQEAASILLDGGSGDELLAVVLATYASQERLSDFVARTYAGKTEAEIAAAYDRLRSARRRLRERLRATQDLLTDR